MVQHASIDVELHILFISLVREVAVQLCQLFSVVNKSELEVEACSFIIDACSHEVLIWNRHLHNELTALVRAIPVKLVISLLHCFFQFKGNNTKVLHLD